MNEPQGLNNREQVSRLYEAAIGLHQSKQFFEAENVYRQIIESFEEDLDPTVQEHVAMSFVNISDAINAQLRIPGRNLVMRDAFAESAISYCDAAVQRYGDSPNVDLRAQAAMALNQKGILFGTIERVDEKIAAYNELVRRFENEEAPRIRTSVAMALGNKASALAMIERFEEAISIFDDVERRFSSDQTPRTQQLVDEARWKREDIRGVALPLSA